MPTKKPDLDRDYIETLLLEQQEIAEKAVRLTARNKAKEKVKLFEEILLATR